MYVCFCLNIFHSTLRHSSPLWYGIKAYMVSQPWWENVLLGSSCSCRSGVWINVNMFLNVTTARTDRWCVICFNQKRGTICSSATKQKQYHSSVASGSRSAFKRTRLSINVQRSYLTTKWISTATPRTPYCGAVLVYQPWQSVGLLMKHVSTTIAPHFFAKLSANASECEGLPMQNIVDPLPDMSTCWNPWHCGTYIRRKTVSKMRWKK